MVEQQILNRILVKKAEIPDRPILVAVDGRCASGKSTVAAWLSASVGCAVFSMDDFFLQPGMRTEERLATPGGNVDHARFLKEVLAPLSQGERLISWQPYDCGTQCLLKGRQQATCPINIIEGAYSHHPELSAYYDLRIFLTVDPELQWQRILARNGPARAERFKMRWIPLEEAYFEAFHIEEQADAVFDGGQLNLGGKKI